MTSGKIAKLPKIGVRDSKLLTARKRSFLYDEIQSLAEEVKSYAISPLEINNAMRSNISLNELEAIHFSRLIDSLNKVNAIYLDSPDVIQERFGIRVSVLSQKPIKLPGTKRTKTGESAENAIKVISEHKADLRYPVVSAASIIAKVVRDEEMEKISDIVGLDLGSGYASDNKTVSTIKQNLNNKNLLPHIREFWKTMDNIRQLRMDEFLGQ